MNLSIDNHDGLGPIDYTGCLAGKDALTLVRKLNEVSVCTLVLDCNVAGTAVPARYARVIVNTDGGLTLFTGYVALSPVAMLIGAGTTGLLYQQHLSALSDEFLLDQQGTAVTAGSADLTVYAVLQALTQRVDPVRFTVTASSLLTKVGFYVAHAAKKWSANAGALLAMARASYRVVNQQVSFLPIGTTTHVFNEAAGSLDPGHLTIAQTKELANDITVCGEGEPQAYVTDVFEGDGTTTTFDLTRKPLTVSSVKGALLNDAFQGPILNRVIWNLSDAGSRISITAAGLAVNGGNGVDGATTVSSIDNMEMGGALVMTAGGVQVGAGSDGYVGGFYNGSVLLENLFAGFHVTQSGGGTVVVPLVNGVAAGGSTPLDAGRAYSFRIRFYSAEMQRVFASYYADGGAGQQLFGGSAASLPAQIVFEVQDTTNGVNAAPVILYDGAVTASPATCFLCAVNSPAFIGSIQSVTLEQTGTAWVRSQSASGSTFTRRVGPATVGADCKVETTQKLTFYATSIPQAGEVITASYRTAGRAVARLQNAASIASQGTSIVPGTSTWVGSVTGPAARSSADCENAALALLTLSTSATAALSGKYLALNAQQNGDIWPGDELVLQSTSLGLGAGVIVRTVTVTFLPEEPETLLYILAFANDWAEETAIRTSSDVPADVWLPRTAQDTPSTLQNLVGLTVAVTAAQINVRAGVIAPSGGGFEVRRVDWQFGAGSDGTLVLRSPVPNFSIVREAAIEQYFIRMYDGSTPPNYSRFSNAICVSVAL